MHKRLTAALAALALCAGAVACMHDPTGVNSDELMLAQNAQMLADNVAATPGAGTTHEGWIRRLLDTLRTTDNPQALADLQQARDYRAAARTAFAAGDTATARADLRLAFRSVLSAIIDIFPNAPERTGLAVDNAIAKIEQMLGNRDAPRIRAILAHVQDLRSQANAAFASGDKVTALALNLRSMQILHRLVEHVREQHRDHDGVADSEMNDVGY